MTPHLTPRVRRTSQNTQYTYNLSRRIYDVKTYPVQSPQGAAILLYAHDNGVTIIWRGGRRFKPTKTKSSAPANEKQNGAPDDSVMIIDSDDEEPPAKSAKAGKASAPFTDKPEFEDSVEDGPYPEIIQTLDLFLGTTALHLAVLPMTPCPAEDAAWGGADVLKAKMVFTVACATNEVYVVTLPLTPPSPESKARPELRSNLLAGKAGSGQWGERVVLLGGQYKHSEGVAMSLIKPKTSSSSDRIREQTDASSTQKPRLVVAAHTREASGTLRLWDVPLDVQPGEASGRINPFQSEYLPSPLSSISFNPTHLTQLLTVASPHAVRIYDYALPSLPPDDQATGPFSSQGSWLLSMFQPFTRPTSTRKPILDAAWIAHGRAVLALLADGTWGIWDVDGASPLGASILGKNSSGIKGAALTTFSASGHVEGTGPLRTTAGVPRSNGNGEFVPLTPHSRRDAAASLSTTGSLERLVSVRGSIVVTPLPGSGSGSADESVVLWIGGLDNVSVIPAVSRFWDAQLRRGSGGGVNLFSGTTPTRMIRLHDLSTGLLGERCCGVGATVNYPKLKETEGGLQIEVLVMGESRLVIVHESEDTPGTKIGSVVSTRRRLFGDKGKAEPPSAIIVHPRPDQPRNVSFNLSVNKTRSLRAKSNGRGSFDAEDPTHDFTLPVGRPKSGFGFTDTLSAAADLQDDVTMRDVEEEMLDILEIDQALENMEDDRGSGRKKVFFEEDQNRSFH
ncbi:Nucleoporin NUP37 [Colletotrichum tanaceti]|uniref:Nucleoporin NUP37 n=1 Tax=Colletotrichum tanaceti TaxID=1306861 RepID=A0A4U6XB17_9PEZI|nr:Nucleoporin NUP37 [Colletotrichum tanaceti]TKW52309.1 Nucleoporin NUP37 [Colletotrichum tanaceti]